MALAHCDDLFTGKRNALQYIFRIGKVHRGNISLKHIVGRHTEDFMGDARTWIESELLLMLRLL